MKKIRNQVIQNNSKITIPILLLSLALVFTLGTHAVLAAPGDTIYVNGSSGNDSWDGQSSAYNGTTGSGPKLSIKNATGTVNVNGTVNIANGIYNGPDNRGITISKNMTIRGQSQTGTIIDAQCADRIFTINSGVNVKIQNLTLENGASELGGAIDKESDGTLTVKNCTFTNNNAQDAGAIFNDDGALTVSDSIFTSNKAASGFGGAIYSGGIITFNNCIFTGNSASDGGAICNAGTMTVNDSTFTGNSADAGGAITTDGGIMNITGCNFTGNEAASGLGGAILYYNSASGLISVVNLSRIVGNSPSNSEIYSQFGTLDATLNWWGSNTSPAGKISTGTNGVVLFDPWLVMNITANPTTINNGATSQVVADLLHDNTGAYHDPTLGHVPDGIRIDLSVPWGSFTSSVINHLVTLNTVNGSVSAILYANEGSTPSPNSVPVRATADGYTTNDAESAYITINPAADVQLAKTTSNIKPNVGQMFTFILTARNNGPDTATGAQITDLIPEGLIFNGYTSSQGTYDLETGIWMVGTILNGSSAVLNLFVTPTIMAAATKVTNTAVLTAEDQYGSTDDIATASVYVQPVVIVIQKTSILTMYSIMGYGISCTDPTVKAARATGMDPTGVPLAGFVAAVLMVLSGLTMPRKK